MNGRSDSDEASCVICCSAIAVYSVGTCDHVVCYNCITRLRVLAGNNCCPICRTELDHVYFCREKRRFEDVRGKFGYCDYTYDIYFEDVSIQTKYFKLMEYTCKMCDQVFSNSLFKEHVSKVHSLTFCKLCLNNIMQFPNERECFSQEGLRHHWERIDCNGYNHHPVCEYCLTSYFDVHGLFRHIRRYHFFCHVCDSPEKFVHYRIRAQLLQHFRDEHYLCEEVGCTDNVYDDDKAYARHLKLKHNITWNRPTGVAQAAYFLPSSSSGNKISLQSVQEFFDGKLTSATDGKNLISSHSTKTFPNLERNPASSSSNVSNSKPLWTNLFKESAKCGGYTEQQFPPLPGHSKISTPVYTDLSRSTIEKLFADVKLGKETKPDQSVKKSASADFPDHQYTRVSLPASNVLKKSSPNLQQSSLKNEPQARQLNFQSGQVSCRVNGESSVYQKPHNYKFRSDKLFEEVFKLCGEKFRNELKNACFNFNNGNMSAAAFHAKCIIVFGEKCFSGIYTEWLALLPDIKKQHEFNDAHSAYLKIKIGMTGGTGCWVDQAPIFTCEKCKQLLIKDDLDFHEFNHHKVSLK